MGPSDLQVVEGYPAKARSLAWWSTESIQNWCASLI